MIINTIKDLNGCIRDNYPCKYLYPNSLKNFSNDNFVFGLINILLIPSIFIGYIIIIL